ncbi:MAG: hypothetical protein NUV57_00015 [archaeon]|nr:hypothetical protein [archaeon]
MPVPKHIVQSAAMIRRYQLEHPQKKEITRNNGKIVVENNHGKISTEKLNELGEKLVKKAIPDEKLFELLFNTEQLPIERVGPIIEYALKLNQGNKKRAIEYLDQNSLRIQNFEKELKEYFSSHAFFKRVTEREGIKMSDYMYNSFHAIDNFFTVSSVFQLAAMKLEKSKK